MCLKTKLKRHYFLWLIIFCQPMQGFSYFPSTISKAERFFTEGLYEDALPLYEKMVYLSAGTHHELLYRLAYCYLENKSPQTALNLLSSFQPFALNGSETFFLMAISHRHLNAHFQALHFLEKIKTMPKGRYPHQIQFEKGLNYFFLYEDEKAAAHFQSIRWDGHTPSLYFSGQLYLARLALIHNYPGQALEILQQFDIPPTHSLGIEKAYLQGISYYLQHNYPQSIVYFQQALSYASLYQPKQLIAILRHLISSYLSAANQPGLDFRQIEELLIKAKSHLDQLFTLSKTDKDYFLLEDLLSARAYLLGDSTSAQAAQELLKRDDWPILEEEKHFRHALHNYKEGIRCLRQFPSDVQAARFFEEAAHSFEAAYHLLIHSDPAKAYQALKYYCLASLFHPTQNGLNSAALLVQDLIDQPSSPFKKQSEMFYLAGLLWKKQALGNSEVTVQAEQALLQASQFSEDDFWTIASGIELGTFYFQNKQWEKAQFIFASLIKKHPNCSEAFFWQALCAEKLKEPQHKQKLMKMLYAQDPQGPLAPLAYFYTFSYREYMQGHRHAIKHLQALPALFPSHPLIVNAHYLIGLDYKKDHLSAEGTLLRPKDLIAAIDSFLQAELSLDQLISKKLIPSSLIPYYTCLRNRTLLERAQANLAVGEISQGAKRRVYFTYAIQVFQNLIEQLKNQTYLNLDSLSKNEVWEESLYGLAQAYIKSEEWEAAEKILNESLAYYAAIQQKNSYFLSQTWCEKGKISFKQQDFANALLYFQQAEKSSQAKNRLISPDQKIEIWIQQSDCYKELGELDKAMLILSKAVNDEAISSLRVKAMYLRADLYERQGRPELALKQLKATANKGGPWAQKAKARLQHPKEKLENYEY